MARAIDRADSLSLTKYCSLQLSKLNTFPASAVGRIVTQTYRYTKPHRLRLTVSWV